MDGLYAAEVVGAEHREEHRDEGSVRHRKWPPAARRDVLAPSATLMERAVLAPWIFA